MAKFSPPVVNISTHAPRERCDRKMLYGFAVSTYIRGGLRNFRENSFKERQKLRKNKAEKRNSLEESGEPLTHFNVIYGSPSTGCGIR